MNSLRRLFLKALPKRFKQKELFDNKSLLGKFIIKMASGKSALCITDTDAIELRQHTVLKYIEGFYWLPTPVESIRRKVFVYVINPTCFNPKTVAVEYDDIGVVRVFDLYYRRVSALPKLNTDGYSVTLKETFNIENDDWGTYLDGALLFEINKTPKHK